MEKSYLSLLPREVRNEVIYHSSLEDVKSLVDAYNINLSIEELENLAERFDLPYSASIEVLIAHNESTIEEKIQYCLKYNDMKSFLLKITTLKEETK